MKKLIATTIFLLVLASASFSQCLSGSYTIGGTTPDYANMSTAITALSTNGVCGPVVFHIRTGTYSGQITIPAITGASAVNTITFQSEALDSNAVIIQAAGSFSNNFVVNLNGADYVHFYKLKISNTNASYSCCVQFKTSADNNSVRNCILQSPYNNSSNYAYIIKAASTDNENILISSNVFQGGRTGIDFSGTTATATSFIVNRNHFLNQRQYAINVSNVKGAAVTENQIYSDTLTNAIRIGYCDDTTNISGNIIRVTTGAGIAVRYSNGSTSRDILVSNNLVQSKTNGISLANTLRLLVCHNTIICNSTSASETCVYLQTTNTTNRFSNNIIRQTNIGLLFYTVISGFFTSDYNDYYSTASVFANSESVPYATFNDWKSGLGQDQHSIFVEPIFVSPTDFHIGTDFSQGSMLPFFPLVNRDIEGTLRDTISPYFGAYEFFNTGLAYDVALGSIISPSQNLCPDTETVEVMLCNYGLNALTSVTIDWTVNGISQAPFLWTGNLPFNDTTMVTIGTIVFDPTGSYQVKAWVSNPNGETDMFHPNDTLISPVYYTMMTGSYTIGGILPDYTMIGEAVADLELRGVCGPVIFDIRDGTYMEQVNLTAIDGASAVNTITFRSESGNRDLVIIYHNDSIINYHTISLIGADYFVFKDLTFKGTTNEDLVVVADGSDYNVFDHNKFDLINYQVAVFTGITALGQPGNNYNRFVNNHFLRGGMGINTFNSGIGTVHVGLEITGNYFEDQFILVLQLSYIDSLTIASNTIRAADTTAGTSISLISLRTFTFEKNDIYTQGSGVYISTISNDTGKVINNLISCFGANQIAGLRVLSTSTVLAYNNTVSVTSVNVNSHAVAFQGEVDFKNNIFSNTGGGAAMESYSTGINGKSDYNDLYVTGTVTAIAGGINYPDISSWTAATGLDSNSIVLDPMFISQENVHISNFAMIGTGTSVAGIISDDIDGEPRNVNAPCIGADEISVSGKDILTYKITNLNPVAIGTISGTNITVTVPYGTNVASLVATFTSSVGSTVKIGAVTQVSGTTPNNFANPLYYTVTAYDLSTKVYCVTVVVEPPLWYNVVSGTTNHLHSVDFVDEQNGWIVGNNGTVLHTSDGGVNWEFQNSGISQCLISVSFTSLTNGWAVGCDQVILHTTDGGQTWNADFGLAGSYFTSVHFVDSMVGWIAGTGNYLLKTSDGGNTWNNVNTGYNMQFNCVHATDANHVRAVGASGAENSIFSVNGGTTWDQNYLYTACVEEYVYFFDNNFGWIVGWGNYRTMDGGDDFSMMNATVGQSLCLYAVKFGDLYHGYCVGENGLITVSNNGGFSWESQYSTTSARLNELDICPNGDTWVVGHDGTILKNGPVGTTGVSASTREMTFEVYPNPAETVLHLRIPEGEVPGTAILYDGRGIVCRTIQLSSDNPEIDICGLPSGMYFIKLIGKENCRVSTFIRK